MITRKKGVSSHESGAADRRDPERRSTAHRRARARHTASSRAARFRDAWPKIPMSGGRRRTICCFELRSLIASSGSGGFRHLSRALTSVERAPWMALVVAVDCRCRLLGAERSRMFEAPFRDWGTPIGYTCLPAEGIHSFPAPRSAVGFVPRTAGYIVYVGAGADGTKKVWVRSLYAPEQRPGAAGHRRGDDAILVARQPMDWILRRKHFEEDPYFKRAHPGHRRRCVDVQGGAAWNVDDVIVFPGFPAA